MFHAIREYFARPDEPVSLRGRGRRLGALFLFEFVVVLLGVLVAQWVADWAQERADLAVMERSKSRMDEEISSAMANAQAWLVAIPCLDDQMSGVMRAAGGDRSLDPATLERPGFRIPSIEPMTPESSLLLIDRYGSKKANLYASMQIRTDHIADLSNRVAEQWMGLSILDPAYGAVREGDRVNARAIASQIRSALRSIQITSQGFVAEAGELGLKPKDIEGRRRPLNCADIRASRTIMPHVALKPR